MLVIAHYPDREATTVGALRSASTRERERAWRTLFEEQFDAVYRLAWRLGTPPAEVEDVVQRVFVVAHRRIQEVDDVQNVGAWLRGIAVRVVADDRKWRRVRRIKDWVLRTSSEIRAETAPTPEATAAARQAQARVVAVLDRMSAKLRDVLVLAELEGLGPQEIAETLGVPLNTARSRKRLAREQFETIWNELHGGGA